MVTDERDLLDLLVRGEVVDCMYQPVHGPSYPVQAKLVTDYVGRKGISISYKTRSGDDAKAYPVGLSALKMVEPDPDAEVLDLIENAVERWTVDWKNKDVAGPAAVLDWIRSADYDIVKKDAE